MKKILLCVALLSLFIASDMLAQNHGWCGTSHESLTDAKNRVINNRALAANSNSAQVRMDIRWVPLQFHILANNDGTSTVDLMKVFEMLCALNDDYLPLDIQFYLHDDFNLIKSTSLNNNPNLSTNPLAQAIMVGNKVASAVNIYIARVIPSAGGIGNTLGFYQGGFDWIVLQRDQISAATVETVTHELGHFFSLPHPFMGWDFEPYEEATHGNPAPAFSPNGTPTENVSGNNCMTAGDAICDTEPNYLFGFTWPNCNFTPQIMDPQGVVVDPQEDNYMAYFIGCSSSFTQGQTDAINNDLDQRTALQNANDFDNTPLTDAPVLNFPINQESTPLYNIVGFDWDPVPGATSYIVQVDKTSNFGFSPSSFKFVTGTYVEFEDIFDANTSYFWRVKAIKEGSACGAVSDLQTGRFTTGGTVSTNDIKEVLNHNISPNPLSADEILNINIETNEGFDATINLYNLSGQKMREVNTTFGLGTSNYELSVANLSQGMYILSIQTETGVLNEKIVVTK